ncbi:TRAP-type C4-dicarboxylate transport system, small permease component [Geomicrobium sp. JCM 19038]|nr:TRAP-type C4-dicarboxylate transport system, small permease component [Geomicrobium sp. JCM 19038]
MSYGQSSPSLQIPMGIIYLAAPIGMGLTSIRLLQQMIKQVRTLMGTGSFEVKTEKDEVLEDVGLKPSNNEGGKQ